MKRFLDKTWAKVVAYFLFFIFTALAVANTAGVVYFFSHEIYLQGEAAAREALYYSQADNVADAVQVWLLNSKSEEEFIKAVRDRCPAENGYGITVTQPDGKNTTVTALPEDAKIVYTYDRWLDIDGKELVITVSLQEGFLPRTYEYRFGLWLLDMKNALIPLTVLFVVLTLFCFFWQMAAAGHWQGFEGIHLTWFDKIPLDLMAVGILIPALAIFGEYYLYSSRLLKALWGTAILCFVYLFIISFVTRCKAGTVLKNNVIWYAIRLLWRILKAIGRWIGHLVRSIPVIWRTALVILAAFIFALAIGSNMSVLSLPMLLLYLLLAVFALLATFYLKVPESWFIPADALQGMVLGYLSHILADMLTPAGVPLLWPCRWRFRLPILVPQKGNQLERFICMALFVWSVWMPHSLPENSAVRWSSQMINTLQIQFHRLIKHQVEY